VERFTPATVILSQIERNHDVVDDRHARSVSIQRSNP
jgi:hypothetical protein